MNTGAFGENFPYSNFHDLNMDWIIKIAKDFLDQYTHIQETIDSGLTALEDKATNLENLLQEWYDTHSEDIANQLADALQDLNNWYNEHSADISNQLNTAIADFNRRANAKAIETIESIPSDYTKLSDSVLRLKYENVYGFGGENNTDLTRSHYDADLTDRIWFRPYEKYGKLIHKITYLAKQGTINFYKVHYEPDNPSAFTYTLLYSVYNSSVENETIKAIDVNIPMGANDYIGINGVFAYIQNDTTGSFTINYTIASREFNGPDSQSLLFNVSSNTSVIYNEIKSVKDDIDGLNSDTLGGVFYENLTPESYLTADLTTMLWFRPLEVVPKHIDKIQFIAVPGTIYFHKIAWTPGTTAVTHTPITSVVNANAEDGIIKTIDVDITLNENEYIGVNGAFAYVQRPANGHVTRNYTIASSALSNEDSQALLFNAYTTDSLAYRVSELEEKTEEPVINRIGEALLYEKTLLSETADIIGSQQFTTYGMVVNGLKILNKYYSISDRTIRYVCRFSSNTVARFGTVVGNNGSYQIDTAIDISIPQRTVKVGSLSAKRCMILNGTDEFIVEITKHYQLLQVKIIDTYTGDSQAFNFVTNGTGGEGAGAIGTGVYPGMQHDYYCMTLLQGNSYHVRRIVIVSGRCDLLIYGDSITEPENYYPTEFFPESWTQLVVNHMNGRAITSGRTGTTINEIMTRIVNELPFIKPKYCMVTIGTNGGDTVENLTRLVQYIKSQGVTPILNHIPCYNNNGDMTGFIAINQMVNTVRQAENIKGCDFDLATSVDHDGQAVDTSKMWYEDYGTSVYYHHPNVKGSACMYARLLIDVPEIFE